MSIVIEAPAEKPALGSAVIIRDHLVRVRLDSEQVLQWAKQWPLFPAGVAANARAFEDRLVKDERPRSWIRRPEFKVWVPASLLEESWRFGLDFNGRDNRRHPVPWLLPMPKKGVLVQQIQLQDGQPFREEYGAEWVGSDSRLGFRIAYDLHRRPLTVLPSMLEILTEDTERDEAVRTQVAAETRTRLAYGPNQKATR